MEIQSLLIVFSVAGSLKNKCALPLESEKCAWIKEQKCGRHGVNVIISDFIELDDCRFSKDVIALNYTFFKDYKPENSN